MSLTFLKIPVNTGSMILMSVVLSFTFFFLMSNGLLGLGEITGTTIDLGFIKIPLDATGTLVLVSLSAALTSVWLDKISGVKRK